MKEFVLFVIFNTNAMSSLHLFIQKQGSLSRISMFSLILTCVFVFSGNRSLKAQAVNESDSLALVALYNATDGANWADNSNWLTGPVVDWYGITVSGDRVTEIRLSSNSLNSYVPSEIGNLLQLDYLDLSHNGIAGIPSEIGSLLELDYMDVSHAQLNEIPLEIGNLNNISYLDIGSNYFGSSFPLGICELSSLTYLNADSCSFVDEIPNEIYNLVSLSYLNLSFNNFTGGVLSDIVNISNLDTLDLSNNTFSGNIPEEIGSLSSLKHLDLSNNSFEGSIDYTILYSNNLIYLNLSHNLLSGDLPQFVHQSSSMEYLNISDNELSGEIFIIFWNLPELNYLNAGSNSITGSLPTYIDNLSKLKELRLSHNQLYGSIPSSIGNLDSLDLLYLENNNLNGNIPSEIGNCQLLSGVSLSNNEFAGALPEELFQVEVLMELKIDNNNFTHVPEFNNQPIFFCNIALNHIEFGDIELIWQPHINYTPQKEVDTAEHIITEEGQSAQFTTTVSGSANHYQWYHEGVLLSGATDSILLFPSVSFADSGTYVCEITSDVVTDLTLTTYEKTLIVTNYVVESDSLALVALYNATDGPNWDDNTNWLSGPVSSWYGITVEGGRAVNISLGSNQLNGTLPAELGNLTNLTGLNLYSNQLSGSIPIELGNLTNLTILDLSYNQLSGSIPPELGNLTNLGQFILNNNSFTGELPEQLNDIVSMRVLEVQNNDLTSIPVYTNWPIILFFYLHSNHIEFQDIEDFKNFGVSCGFNYTPQKEVDTPEHIIAEEGQSAQFTTTVSGSANHYQWYHEGVLLSGATDSILLFPSVSFADSGTYVCEITSDVVTDLTLTTYEKTLTVTNYVVESDSLALVALYNATDGPNWDDNTNWLSGPVSSWYGITLAGNRVETIYLKSNNLFGAIPSEIGLLTEMDTLDLSENYSQWDRTGVGGSLPPEIGDLAELDYMDLSGNSLGHIPPEIGDLDYISYLNIGSNRFDNNSLLYICELTTLTYLEADSCLFSGVIPDEVYNLVSLSYLNLSYNNFTGSISSDLSNLSTLDTLDLSNNSLSGNIPNEISAISTLNYLNLSNNSFEGSIDASILYSNNLIYLI